MQMPMPIRTTLPTEAEIFWNSRNKEAVLKVLFGLLIILVALNTLARTVADPDLWGYMAFGRLFWETGRFPYQDIFAYVPTLKIWVYHEWLTGVLFFPIYRALGAAGLQLLKFTLGLTTVWFIYLTAGGEGPISGVRFSAYGSPRFFWPWAIVR
jgi:hypothetical protein